MDKPKVTPKDFFLWAGAMVALYWSVIAFIFLIFNYINYTFPDTLSYLPNNPYDSGIGNEMASIVVLFPVYIVLMWFIRNDIARDPSRADIWVRRWALILTLFVAGVTVIGDLISLLAAFFTGEEFTTAFLLKSGLLLLIGAGAFMHFIADYWGYWEKNEGKKKMVCYSVGAVAVISIIAGFWMFGTPFQARQYRYDEQRVNDLQSIQSQITSYWQAKQSLPVSLGDLKDSLSGWEAPTDPLTKESYSYTRAGRLDFTLCATFAAASRGVSTEYAVPTLDGGRVVKSNWDHAAGEACFSRTIDPELYPPTKR